MTAPRTGPIKTALAAGVPLACYLATCSAEGYWLDGGEFVSVGADFGIAHPPGQPLAALLLGIFARLPLGSLAFRASLMSAICVAIAAGLIYRSSYLTLRTVVHSPAIAIPLSYATTWTISGSLGWWFQAIRPEVYALQAALVAFVIERVCTLLLSQPTRDNRPLYHACIGLGLGLTNHHLLAFLILPAFALALASVVQADGFRPMRRSIGLGTTALLVYAYLPLRSLAATTTNGTSHPYLLFGEPDTMAKFWWVVSAKAFQKNQGAGVPQAGMDRVFDAIVAVSESLHPVVILLAIIGFYVAMRTSSQKRLITFWLLVASVFLAARAWLGFIRNNPDALGYLMPAIAALGVAAGCGVAVMFGFISGPNPMKPRRTAIALAWCFALLAIGQFPRNAHACTLANFHATDDFDDALFRHLPNHAVVLTYSPQTIFKVAGGRAAERSRPDLLFVPIPFLPYPGMIDRLLKEEPELRPLLRGYQLEGELRQPDLQSLAARRPLLIEMDTRVPPALYETLVPNGLYYEVLPGGATDADQKDGAIHQQKTWDTLQTQIGLPSDEETRGQILWRRYLDSLFFAAVDDRESAQLAVSHARTMNDQAAELVALQKALETVEGPIDITPFLP